jgi:DNA polymerase-3 subunit gamma/tau
MGQALYRSYRSKNLSEIVGQEHITTALDNALKNGTISHAYLFTGPRGVGKTSIARILAHEINYLPYEDNERQHLDIIEIDAASNRRIDEIRDLRDKVHIAPSISKFKVYIIDEVHMLTKEAFNALLKTLEEPPAHVVFILATTEVHKLPETIISRTQRYAFKPVDLAKVVAHLKTIATKEKIDIEDAALELIAAHGEGSFRDSISLLDQVRNSSAKVTLGDVQATLGIAPEELITNMLSAIQSHDALAASGYVRQMHEQGYEPSQVARQLGAALRREVVASTYRLGHEVTMKLLTQLVQIPASSDPRVALEICLLDAALSGVAPAVSAPIQTPAAPVAKAAKPTPAAAAPVAAPVVTLTPIPEPKVAPLPQAASEAKPITATKPIVGVEEPSLPAEVSSDLVLDDNWWHDILAELKKAHNSIYLIARAAQTHYEPGKLTLEVPFKLHQKSIMDMKSNQIITKCIAAVTGKTVIIDCIIGKGKPVGTIDAGMPPSDGEIVHNASATPNPTTPVNPVGDDFAAIANIFGGAEVLES